MALRANYNGATKILNAYLKIERIWGSPREGWNCFVGVYANKTDTTHQEVFTVHTTYVENVNPFQLLYTEIGKLSFLSNVQHDIEVVTVAPVSISVETSPEVVSEPQPARVEVKPETVEVVQEIEQVKPLPVPTKTKVKKGKTSAK